MNTAFPEQSYMGSMSAQHLLLLTDPWALISTTLEPSAQGGEAGCPVVFIHSATVWSCPCLVLTLCGRCGWRKKHAKWKGSVRWMRFISLTLSMDSKQ